MVSKYAAGFLAVILILALGCANPQSAVTKSSDKAITAFSLSNPSVVGKVDEASHTVAVTVPFGTMVTALTPSITHAGTSLSPASGAAQDFSRPVTYTVTAADGSTQGYVVTVTVASNTAKAITGFTFSNPAATGTVDETAHTVAVTVPFGTSVTALVPGITHTGASLSPASGTPQDFTNSVTYTVTAADGSTRGYVVTVTVASNTAKAITGFTFSNPVATGTVDETAHTVAVTVPFGTSVTALVPTVTHTGASLSPASGAAQNFTSPVTYTVTAANGSTQAYTVAVTVAASTNANLSALSVSSGTLSPSFAPGTTTYTLTVANSVTSLTVTGTKADANASVTGPVTLSNLVVGVAQTATITVTAPSGTTKSYTVAATRQAAGSSWRVGALPSYTNWTSVTYGGGLFAAVANGGTDAATSPDGITWTARTLPTSSPWTSVTFGAGVFVAVASGGTDAATSPDGIHWTARTLPSAAAWQSVTYGGGLFVVVANGGNTAATSTDGTNWTARTLPTNAEWTSVTFGNGLLVAVSSGGTAGATSSDGASWTARTLPSPDYPGNPPFGWNSVAYGNGLFVTVPMSTLNGTGTKVATSSDGVTWTKRNSVNDNGFWSAVAYGSGTFVSVSRYSTDAMTSTDGISWTTVHTLPSAGFYWSSLAYGNGAFVAVSTDGVSAVSP